MGSPCGGREAEHKEGNLKPKWRRSSKACFQWRRDGGGRLGLHGREFSEAC